MSRFQKIAIIVIPIFIVVFVYLYTFTIPMSCLRSEDFRKTSSEKRIRAMCHRVLIWGKNHDASVMLAGVGDRSSVPFLIWAMPKDALKDGLIHCSDGHCYEALREITNQDPGSGMKLDWFNWYMRNMHKTTMEWWVDGFNAAGYKVSAKGGEHSIHTLLRLVGKKPEREDYMGANALQMLTLFEREEVNGVIKGVVHSDSELEKKGADEYWKYRVFRFLQSNRHENITHLKQLLEINPGFMHVKDLGGEAALHWAANYGDSDLAEMLITEGAKVDEKDNYGDTSLHNAALFSNIEVVKLLLSKGADINAKDKGGGTALLGAIGEEKEKEKMAEYLIRNGANVNVKYDENGNTPLHRAVCCNSKRIAELLIEEGADLNAKNNKGETALEIAETRGYKDIVAIFPKRGDNK